MRTSSKIAVPILTATASCILAAAWYAEDKPISLSLLASAGLLSLALVFIEKRNIKKEEVDAFTPDMLKHSFSI